MIVRIMKISLPILVIFLIYLVYSSFADPFIINLLRWGEIVFIIGLFAGLYRFILKKAISIKKFNSGSFYSAVTVIAFICTFLAGMINSGSERFAFNNIIREQPGYLVEATGAVIEDDEYFKNFPAKNKLALLIASKISSHFVPTDEMLKNSGMSAEDYNLLVNPGSSQIRESVQLIKDDREYAERIRLKVTKVSRETVGTMIPVVEKIKDWATGQISSGNENDLVLKGRIVKGSGDILKGEMKNIRPMFEADDSTSVDIYRLLSKNRDFIDGVSAIIAPGIGGEISEKAKKKVIASFIRTGVSVSPRMKGVIRWIYRYIYDPLFSTFMAILVFFMIIAAYRHFDLRKYSTAVITLSAVSVMLGFLPQVAVFIRDLFHDSWQGPVSSGWIMNVFAVPVFKAFAIGAGTGVVYMYIRNFRRSFDKGDGNG